MRGLTDLLRPHLAEDALSTAQDVLGKVEAEVASAIVAMVDQLGVKPSEWRRGVRERQRSSCWRPITDEEAEGLERLGAAIRRLRKAGRVSQQALAAEARINPSFLWRVEVGARRVRPERLRDIATALVSLVPSLGDADQLAEEWTTTAGAALASPSESPERRERLQRRRVSRQRRLDRLLRGRSTRRGRPSP